MEIAKLTTFINFMEISRQQHGLARQGLSLRDVWPDCGDIKCEAFMAFAAIRQPSVVVGGEDLISL